MNVKELAKLIDSGKVMSKVDVKRLIGSGRFSDVLEHVSKDSSKELLSIKPTRGLSGVTVIAIMCKPHECPGKCVYCPKGGNAPQSYTGYEPATMRAIRNDYDSYNQVIDRLSQYKATGHDVSKIEVVVMGGTFLSTSIEYQESFIRGLYQALNNTKTESISELKKENETAMHRCVALTFETRPDVCSDSDIKRMVSYGATRCELGLQSVYDDVLKLVNRGHDVNCVKDAIKRLKDAGLKVDLHIMIGLPGSSEERDINMFRILFSDEGLRPDGLKIYPCLVMQGTKLYDDWVSGKYVSLTDETAVRVIGKGMELIPPYVRVKRVMRDIPINLASAGPKKSNMHELALKIGECNCIRCRETGRSRVASDLSLHVFDYDASGGKEFLKT